MQKLEITRWDHSLEELKALYRNEKNVRMKERILALIHILEGKSCTEVGAILKRDRNTIQLWVKSYNKGGLEGLRPIKSPGRPSSLTKEQLNELKADIQKNPRELGYEFSNWTGKSAAMHIEKKFGVRLKVRRVIVVLHALEFTLQRPRHKLIKADPAAQATFQETLQKKNENLGTNAVLLFEDECCLKYSPTLTRMWAQKGAQPQIPTLGNHEKVNLFGTINPLLGEAFCLPAAYQNAQEFQTFLEAVLDRYADKDHILLILDNARSHHAKYLRSFLKKHTQKLELLFLPPYSPNLNVMERIWRFIRKMVSHNTFFETFKKFTDALFSFLQKLAFPSASLRTLCGNS